MMQNPFGSQRVPGPYSYVNLKKRLIQNIQAAGINDEIFNALQKAFEIALEKENVPLIRIERQRLFVQIMKDVLNDMLTKLENRPKS